MNGKSELYPAEYFKFDKADIGERTCLGNEEIIKNDAWIGKISYIPISFWPKNEAIIAINNANPLTAIAT